MTTYWTTGTQSGGTTSEGWTYWHDHRNQCSGAELRNEAGTVIGAVASDGHNHVAALFDAIANWEMDREVQCERIAELEAIGGHWVAGSDQHVARVAVEGKRLDEVA